MSDNLSPEITQSLKRSDNPFIQRRVDLEREKIITKNPITHPEAANQHARDKVASQIRIERLKNELKEAEERSYIDPLTGLKNRRWFNEQLEERTARAVRTDKPLWLLTLDFDKFKDINTQYGQEGGDKALKLISQLESRSEEPMARLGGDEFAQFLDEDIDEEGIAVITDRYIKNMTEKSSQLLSEMHPIIAIDRNKIMKSFGLCLGVTRYVAEKNNPDLSEKPNEFLHRADLALKVAKAYPGKNKGYIAEQTADGVIFKEIKEVQRTSDELTNG